MTILVTGAAGFVGRRIMQQYPGAVAAPSLRDATEDCIRALIDRACPDIIIHTAAISDIGTCEANPEASYRANVQLPVLLAKWGGGAKLIAFSSDQVYSGSEETGPYREEDVNPANLYARHKLEMEQRVLDADPGAVLLRAEWMYDYVSPRGNYFRNILGTEEDLFFSSRQYRGVTYLREVAEAMDAVIRLPGGAYNFGSETDRSMLELTREFLAWMGRPNRVLEGPQRHNLWMDCRKARQNGVHFSSVQDGLKHCAADYGLKEANTQNL